MLQNNTFSISFCMYILSESLWIPVQVWTSMGWELQNTIESTVGGNHHRTVVFRMFHVFANMELVQKNGIPDNAVRILLCVCVYVYSAFKTGTNSSFVYRSAQTNFHIV